VPPRLKQAFRRDIAHVMHPGVALHEPRQRHLAAHGMAGDGAERHGEQAAAWAGSVEHHAEGAGRQPLLRPNPDRARNVRGRRLAPAGPREAAPAPAHRSGSPRWFAAARPHKFVRSNQLHWPMPKTPALRLLLTGVPSLPRAGLAPILSLARGFGSRFAPPGARSNIDARRRVGIGICSFPNAAEAARLGRRPT
jgi:hypothetical protein